MTALDHLWAIVLAGGEGQRLRELTEIPKQFCSFGESNSMVHWAVDRAARVVPLQRIVAVVSEPHRRWWEQELDVFPPENVVVQPHGRGTAAGILLPLLRIMRRDPDATVIVLPSDHYVADEEVLHRSLEEAAHAALEHPERAVLLGVTPDGPETEYGWILPLRTGDGSSHFVAGFIEKPGHGLAEKLLAAGAVWNTFMFASSARTLVWLLGRTAPELVRALATAAVADDPAVAEAYARLPELDFSRDVLERVVDRLAVFTVPPCGWTDLGTPRRLQRHLARQHDTVAG